MNIKDFIKELRNNNISISLKEGNLLIGTDEPVIPSKILENLRTYKIQIIDFLKTNEKINFIPLVSAPLNTSYTLSSSQRRLWVLSQFEEGNLAYNIPGFYEFRGDLNVSVLESSFHLLIARHEILRTVFKADASDEVRQFILPSSSFTFILQQEDLSTSNNQDKALQSIVERELRTAFDLSDGPLLRATLVKLSADRFVFCYVMHHIISDGWSMGVLIKELLAFYNSAIQGKQLILDPLTIQYKDYAFWQQQQLNSSDFETSKAYWLNRFEGELPVLELPSDFTRPVLKTYKGSTLRSVLDESVNEGLKQLGAAHGTTLFMSLLAAVNTFLYKYTHQTDIIIGSPIAGRDHADLENQIGFYVNTLALRTEFSAEDSFLSVLEKVKTVALEAYSHQSYPFDELVDALSLRRDLSRNALFDVMLVLQNTEIQKVDQEQLGDVTISHYEQTEDLMSKFDLTFNFIEVGNNLHLHLEYNTDLFKKETVEGFLDHFNELVKVILFDPSVLLKDIDYLTEEEKHTLLVDFNDTKVGYPTDQTIIDLFESQVKNTPDSIALVFENKSFSYDVLNRRSNQLAHYLRSKEDLKSDDLIGIQLPRSEWQIISILAVLKSAGAYVPIDPDYPQQRIDFIVSDSKCKYIVDQHVITEFESLSDQYTSETEDNLVSINTPSDLAYVIYTSGTTGTPKGVMVEHSNVVRLFKTDAPLFDFGSNDVWTLFHSFSFDFSVWEIFGALLFGGKLVIVPKETAQDANAFLTLLEKEQVTILNQTPSSFYSLIKEDSDHEELNLSLKTIIFGGEALSPGRLLEWKARYPHIDLINMYGITETTVHVTHKKITDLEIAANRSNIGSAIPTLNCYVFDSNQHLVPIGVEGELYIGGSGVARGYLNNKELTEQRFIQNPFVEGERLYRSGDKVKMLKSGEMEYHGRIDDQVKIRGYRIELGEIENRLNAHEKIDASVVVSRTDSNDENTLVGYLVSKEELITADLRQYLKGFLPDYMIPSYFVQVKELPLTSNGKVNKKALPNPEELGIGSGKAYVAPRNETEERLVKIWEEILGQSPVSVTDDFFELGGHSLKATRVIAKISQETGIKLGLKDFFSNSTIEQISLYLNRIIWLKTDVKTDNQIMI